MERSWYLRTAVLFVLIGVAGVVLYPTYFYFYKATQAQRDSREQFCAALPSFVPCKHLNLGLDLQGGVHLVMGVRVDKAIEHRVDRIVDALKQNLTEHKVAFSKIDRSKDVLRVVLANQAAFDAARSRLQSDFSVLRESRVDAATFTLTYSLRDEEITQVRDAAVEQAIKTIRNRADKLGVTEPVIARRGVDSILIQLPGIQNPDHAIDVIGRTAQLEFKMVETEQSAALANIPQEQLPTGVVRKEGVQEGRGGASIRDVFFELPESQKEALLAVVQSVLPENTELAFADTNTVDASQTPMLRTYLLASRAGITGDYLTDARVEQDRDMASNYYVSMTFDAQGAQVFEKLTAEHVRRQMAIVLDGKVNSAPTIQEKIGGGTARITLGGVGSPEKKFEEAKDLALVLKAGALPAPVEIQEKRQVGKTLGQDTVHKGATAMAVGCGLVIVFMLLYYHLSGLLANVALMLNALFMMAILAFVEATLTLPGMAGIALTIGMAVDANVIIFERIREELTAGKAVRAAIEGGFDKAFTSIFDANVTTVLAAIVLMQYGSGPVRGFAVTLIVGITCSMYTAIVVTRLMFDRITARSTMKTLSI